MVSLRRSPNMIALMVFQLRMGMWKGRHLLNFICLASIDRIQVPLIVRHKKTSVTDLTKTWKRPRGAQSFNLTKKASSFGSLMVIFGSCCLPQLVFLPSYLRHPTPSRITPPPSISPCLRVFKKYLYWYLMQALCLSRYLQLHCSLVRCLQAEQFTFDRIPQ